MSQNLNTVYQAIILGTNAQL